MLVAPTAATSSSSPTTRVATRTTTALSRTAPTRGSTQVLLAVMATILSSKDLRLLPTLLRASRRRVVATKGRRRHTGSSVQASPPTTTPSSSTHPSRSSTPLLLAAPTSKAKSRWLQIRSLARTDLSTRLLCKAASSSTRGHKRALWLTGLPILKRQPSRLGRSSRSSATNTS